jgi:hypothetical protein
MLVREELGGRQKDGLRSSSGDLCTGHHRDGGLAASDVALKQASHWGLTGQRRADLRDGDPLRLGELERKGFAGPRNCGLDLEAARDTPVLRGAPQPKCQLPQHELFERKPVVRRRR